MSYTFPRQGHLPSPKLPLTFLKPKIPMRINFIGIQNRFGNFKNLRFFLQTISLE